jgi:hypothetical protein
MYCGFKVDIIQDKDDDGPQLAHLMNKSVEKKTKKKQKQPVVWSLDLVILLLLLDQ